MATTVHVPLETYLNTGYSPDVEYIDGEIRERAGGTYEHSEWQAAVVTWFRTHAQEWKLWANPELRIQTRPTSYRVPDVTLLDESHPLEEIVVAAPLATFEILSPTDTWLEVAEKSREYAAMGVSQIWVVDPVKELLWLYADEAFIPRTYFEMKERGIRFEWEEVRATVRRRPRSSK